MLMLLCRRYVLVVVLCGFSVVRESGVGILGQGGGGLVFFWACISIVMSRKRLDIAYIY